MLAKVSIRQLANILLIAAEHFYQALMCLQSTVKNKVENKEEEDGAVKYKMALCDLGFNTTRAEMSALCNSTMVIVVSWKLD